MNIWLINPYGPIPIPEEDWREYRFTIIGNYLSSMGHNVIWFTSSFSHHFKMQRSNGWKDIEINPLFTIKLVPNPGYKKNISFGRIFRDWVFSYKVYKQRKTENKPDLIIYNESPLSFGYAGQKLAAFFDIPVIFDQMDLWPELMINSFPKNMQTFTNLLFYPVFYYRKKTYERVSGFISLAKLYLTIPLEIVPTLKNIPHAIIYNGIDVNQFRKETPFEEELKGLLPEKKINDIWYVFAGTLGPSYDILNLIKVAKIISSKKIRNIKFLIAGDGPLKNEILDFIEHNNENIITYLGKLKPASLANLYKTCDVGLSTYTEISNVEMPDKFYDYTAAGLPIINSLTGEVGDIVKKENIGLNYISRNTDELYNSVLKLANDSALRKCMGEKSWELGLNYDKNNQIKKLGIVIDTIMKSKPKLTD